MQRIMIVGQPGSGKSTLARLLAQRSGLPVFYMDQIHWQPGWVERAQADKARLCAEVEAQERWIFEGGFARSYANRMARADLLIWLDMPLGLRMWRVIKRNVLGRGKSRADLPENCPETLSLLPEFLRYIWQTRVSGRERIAALVAKARPEMPVVILRDRAAVQEFVSTFD